MDMHTQVAKTLTQADQLIALKAALCQWHGQLMPVQTSMAMISKDESTTIEGAEIRATVELFHERLTAVLNDMDRASLNIAAVESLGASEPVHEEKDLVRSMSFPFTNHSKSLSLYQINPAATNADILAHLSVRISQLHATLLQVSGRADELTENFLHTCQMLAHECEDLVENIEFPSD